jgi:hypothetical protein
MSQRPDDFYADLGQLGASDDLRPVYERLDADARAWTVTVDDEARLIAFARALPRRSHEATMRMQSQPNRPEWEATQRLPPRESRQCVARASIADAYMGSGSCNYTRRRAPRRLVLPAASHAPQRNACYADRHLFSANRNGDAIAHGDRYAIAISQREPVGCMWHNGRESGDVRRFAGRGADPHKSCLSLTPIACWHATCAAQILNGCQPCFPVF